MSAVAVQMEVEEGANATVTDLITAMAGEEELELPRNTQVQHRPSTPKLEILEEVPKVHKSSSECNDVDCISKVTEILRLGLV